MSSQNELDRAAAERLVRGGRAAWLADRGPLAGVLAAASAPPHPDELVGRGAALAAFRAAPHDPVPQLRRWQMIKASIAKLLTVKAAVVCAATLGLGGVALAATTGNLPGPLGAGRPSASPTPHPGRSGGLPSAQPSHTVPPPPDALVRLCRDYLGKDADHRGRAIRERGFHELADHVGGQDRGRADDFCDRVLHHWPTSAPTAWPTGLPTAWPTSTPWPTGTPGNPQTPRPTDGHSETPTPRPTQH